MSDALARLKIEHWYHVFIIVGAAGAVAALTVEFNGVDNAHAFLIAAGLFFAGIGEWINHPLQTTLLPPNAYMRGGGKITSYKRQPPLLGNLFDILGFVLSAAGCWKIFSA